MAMPEKPTILIIHRGAAPPEQDTSLNLYHALSKRLKGDLVSTSWDVSEEEVQNSQEGMGDFNYHRWPLYHRHFPISTIRNLYNLFGTAFRLCRKNKYDALVTYGPYLNSVLALVFRAIFKIPVIVQVPGHPVNGFISRQKHSFFSVMQLKKFASKSLARFVCKRADYVKTLYPEQLDSLDVKPEKLSIFHGWVPVTALSKNAPKKDADKKYMLTMGMPWYLKGVDLSINAFHEIADDYPDLHLKVVGYEVNDRAYFEDLADNHPRIELCTPLEPPEAHRAIANAELFVLASRTEAMGRVLLESMAFQVPIVASRVDGVPHYLDDGVTGLLFEPGNFKDLALKLRQALDDEKAREERVKAAHEKLLSVYNEETFVREFADMVDDLVALRTETKTETFESSDPAMKEKAKDISSNL